MDFSTLILFGIVTYLGKGEPCALPNGDIGVCKPLEDCELLMKISNRHGTGKDAEFLSHSRCEIDENEEGVIMGHCCPKSGNFTCFTPEHMEGQCVSLETCPHLAELAEDKHNATLLKEYECTGPEENSYCCGPSPEIISSRSEYEEDCEKNATAFPPDLSTDCCGIDNSFQNRILGGNATAIDEYPWLVAIEYVKNNLRGVLCGGSLISVKYVLTAAHCIKGSILFVGKPKFVRLGDYDITNRGPDCMGVIEEEKECTNGALIVPVERTITHPNFRPYHGDRRFDIGLIRMRLAAPYTGFIRPICLPQMDYAATPPAKFQLLVAGWGTYYQDFTANIHLTSHVKQHVDIPYVNRQTCEPAIQRQRNTNRTALWEGQICAGGVLGKDSCNADSGGPLMYEKDRVFELVGIVSFGATVCGQEGQPAVYTSVYEYIPWIKKAIKPYSLFYFT